MFCYKCGKQLSDDALFCQYCGTNQQRIGDGICANQQSISMVKATSGELDRNALTIYLGNVLSLECAIAKYKRELTIAECSIECTQEIYHYYKRFHLQSFTEDYGYIHFKYDGKFHLAWFNNGSGYYGAFRWADLKGSMYHWLSWKEEKEIKFLRKSAYWKGIREYKECFFIAYEKFKVEAPSAYQNIVESNNKDIEFLNRKIGDMSIELANAEKLLEQAYGINIIPSQFRHQIPVLYYLHDFLSTSQESFTTALLHLDLDEIKSKLDRIIDQQESIILQNAAMIAQNDKMIRQNQMHLDQLAQIEQNTSQAAQYVNIAANNAAVCAWFSAANYIEAHR